MIKRFSSAPLLPRPPAPLPHTPPMNTPPLATAHSHAFQRALRGRTQRRATAAGSFWSWRGLMYELAAQLDPDDVFQLSRWAFVELALGGTTAVGEFHYLHHQPDGTPYPNRLELAEAVIAAAHEVGVRLCLIRTAYLRGGFNQPLASAQIRFADAAVDDVLRDVDALRTHYAADPLITVGVAAHSIRAVPLPQVATLAGYAQEAQLPFHMHLAEQRQELAECVAEYGRTPIALLADHGLLAPNWVAVHATHLADEEVAALGQAGAMVCLCRTTERDLGDGLPRTADLLAAGVRLCVGVDSHAVSDTFEELRAVELDERSRTERRHAAAEAAELLRMGGEWGYAALGMGQAWSQDRVVLNPADPALLGLADWGAEAAVFAASPRAVQEVWVAGRQIVADGHHAIQEVAAEGYRRTLKKLGL